MKVAVAFVLTLVTGVLFVTPVVAARAIYSP
jgi:hypothetical protein